MFWVYVIKSSKKDWFYVGLTSNMETRLLQHNAGRVRSTKQLSPYKLIYGKQFDDRINARDFEKFLKIRSNKEKLLKELGCFK